MPDITMCKGGKCPLKEDCYRYKAKPSPYRQTYFAKPPYKEDKCEYFSEIWQRWKPSSSESSQDNPNKV